MARPGWCTLGTSFVALALLETGAIAQPLPDGPRRFEVRDSIQMAKFTEATSFECDPRIASFCLQRAEPQLFSPDGRWFVCATERGVLPEGVTESTVWLFDVSETRKKLMNMHSGEFTQPIALARISATVNDSTLMRLKWEQDSQSLLFLGRDGRENRQLFRVRLRDRKLTALTPPTQDVVDYALSAKRIVYFAGPDISAEKFWWSNDPDAPDIVTGAGKPLMDLLYPNYQKNARGLPTPFEVWQIRGGRAEPVADSVSGRPMRILGSYSVDVMALAPGGGQFVAITYADRIPALWQQYEVPPGPDYRSFRADPGLTRYSAPTYDYDRALEYEFIDLIHGIRRTLLDAPLADFQRGGNDTLRAAWSPDGRLVAVSGSYLPFSGSDDSPSSKRPCGVAVIDTQVGDIQCLIVRNSAQSPAAVKEIRWDGTSDRIGVLSDGSGSALYARQGKRWTLTGEPPKELTLPLELTVQQSLNEPPALFAGPSGSAVKIFDPNPQLAGIDLGTASVYKWKDKYGREITGGLVRPPRFDTDRRYPLVVQTHNFRPRRFFRVGASETAAAGRALAARDLLVLQVDEPDPTGTWQEGEQNGVDVYLAAIDQLTADGLVDSQRVGITGYSRTGEYVAKAITLAPDRFAAAALANTDPGTLTGYETYIVTPQSAVDAAKFFAGEKPYGNGLQKWVERAPGFRTDAIRAPVLISAADPQHLISLWGLYAPLRDQGKPVELQYFRSGAHNLAKPLQIFAHQEMLVDWFDFWLNGHEDSASAKTEQYARWRDMRDKREQPMVRAPATSH